MKRQHLSAVAILVCGLALSWPYAEVRAQDIPALANVSSALPPEEGDDFRQRKVDLEAAYQRFKAASDSFNLKSAEEQTDADYDRLLDERRRYIAAANAFNSAMASRIAAHTRRVLAAMSSYAGQLDWAEPKRARLIAALGRLGSDGDAATSAQIRQAWSRMLTRYPTVLAREAASGAGPGLPGAGRQTGYDDCTIFALAHATGRPYGVIAAGATNLIRQGSWRTSAERADPQRAIEDGGLMSGEVVMLAAVFGEAEVVPSSAFPRILGEGRPVLVNVVPQDGDVDEGHEVVLTRTFQHGGETWYEMLDSNQGPSRRLYLSSAELGTILQENGVVFRADSGRTPALLRTR
jgi:hypothetical protein